MACHFTSADFFPAPFQFNPAPEIDHGNDTLHVRLSPRHDRQLSRVMLWAGSHSVQAPRPLLGKEWLRCLGVLLILLTEQPLFEINNYMIDLLAVPLLLEATLIIVDERS